MPRPGELGCEICLYEDPAAPLAGAVPELGLIAYLVCGAVTGLLAAFLALAMGPSLWGDTVNVVLGAGAGLGAGLLVHVMAKRDRPGDPLALHGQDLSPTLFQVAL